MRNLLILLLLVGQYVATGYTPTAASGPNCSLCALVTATNSGNSSANNDPTTINSVVAGNFLITWFTASNWTSGATASISDSKSNTYYPCNSSTAASSMTEIEVTTGIGLSCFYAVDVASGNTTITVQPSQCSSTKCSLGGTYAEYSGIASTASAAFDSWGDTVAGTSTSGSNNTECANTNSMSASQTDDLILCGMDMNTGTSSAGTSPVTFTQDQVGTWVALERVVWTGSGSINPHYTDSVSGDAYGSFTLALK